MAVLLVSASSASAGEVHQTVATASGNLGTFEQNVSIRALMPLIVQAPNADEAFSHTMLDEIMRRT
jgi:hypothetical protein